MRTLLIALLTLPLVGMTAETKNKQTTSPNPKTQYSFFVTYQTSNAHRYTGKFVAWFNDAPSEFKEKRLIPVEWLDRKTPWKMGEVQPTLPPRCEELSFVPGFQYESGPMKETGFRWWMHGEFTCTYNGKSDIREGSMYFK